MALFRALESRLPEGKRLFSDPYAHEFLGARLRAVLAAASVPVTGRAVMEAIDRRSPGSRIWVVGRTRFIDETLARLLAHGLDQVVVLGAGFDARAYRIAGIDRAQVIEVDAPPMSERKRGRMRELLGELPAHVTFAAADFERDDLRGVLGGAGLDDARPAMFIWEGVTSYLEAAAVDATLEAVAASAGRGSTVAFTFLDGATLRGERELPGANAAMDAVRRAGEPFRFGLDPEELHRFLAERGFELGEQASAAVLAKRYLEPLGRDFETSPFFHLALART